MAKVKKNDRVCFSAGNVTRHGVVLKSGVKVSILTDEDQTYSVSEILVVPSREPLVPGSRISKAITKIGAVVEFNYDGEKLRGVIKGYDYLYATVRTSTAEYKISQLNLTDVTDLVSEPASPMDDWGVKGYKEYPELSEETVAYSAKLTYKGKVVLEASNKGNGGCDNFSGDYSMVQKLNDDASEWAKINGDDSPFEPASSWVMWKQEHNASAVSARDWLGKSLVDSPSIGM